MPWIHSCRLTSDRKVYRKHSGLISDGLFAAVTAFIERRANNSHVNEGPAWQRANERVPSGYGATVWSISGDAVWLWRDTQAKVTWKIWNLFPLLWALFGMRSAQFTAETGRFRMALLVALFWGHPEQRMEHVFKFNTLITLSWIQDSWMVYDNIRVWCCLFGVGVRTFAHTSMQ